MKAAAYLRVSTSNQSGDDRFGLERQLKDIQEYANREGIALVETYKDVITGKSTTRTGLNRLKENFEAFDLVIISSVDRLARTVNASYITLAELLELGLQVHSSDFGEVDLDDEKSLIQFNLRSLFSHIERNSIVKRTKAAHVAMAEKGIPPLGVKTYGYKSLEGSVFVVPERAEVVKRIFEMSADGVPLRAIAKTLTEEGIEVSRPEWKKGLNVWHYPVITKILQNPTYKGEHFWSYKGRRWTIPVPAIVSPELWDKAQKKKVGAHAKQDWVLLGHLRCGECGRRMNSKTKRFKDNRAEQQWYRCNSMSQPVRVCTMGLLNRKKLEQFAEEEVRKALSSEKVVRGLLGQQQEKSSRPDAELANLDALEKELLETLRLGGLSAAEFTEFRNDIRKKRNALNVKLDVPKEAVKSYVEMAKTLEFRDLLEASGVVVVVGKDFLRITLE
jgi:DNA invertase Pin-like site-specific DNA recombinase